MDLPKDIEAYCVCPICTRKHLQPISHRGTCYMIAAKEKHIKVLGVLTPKDSRFISIEFKNPVRPNADGEVKSVHVAVLAYFSRVVGRMVTGALSSTSGNKRIVTVIEFEDDILKPGDVNLLVEWCATGGLASLATAYSRPAPPNDDSEVDEEMHDDEDREDDENSSKEDQHDIQQREDREQVMKKRKQKANVNKKLEADRKDYHSRRIPEFAAEDTLERLYCVAVDLEMPEFANYIMGLIMAKYAWNFFSTGPIEIEKDEFTGLSDLARIRKMDEIRREEVERERRERARSPNARRQQRHNKPKDKAKKKRDFRGRDCKVPFKLMFHDAPFETDGLRFASIEVIGQNSNPTRNHLSAFMLALSKQRNPQTTQGFACEPDVYIQNWKAVLDADEAFSSWYSQHFRVPTPAENSLECRKRVYRLLDWTRYMIDVDKIRECTEFASPAQLWAKLMHCDVQHVVVEEHVRSRPLRTRDDNAHLAQWMSAKYQGERAGAIMRLAQTCTNEIHSVKTNPNMWRFGDN